MLMPAAVLIVVLLGSMAVDFAVVFLAQRELGAAAAAAANDAATYGIDEAAYRRGEGYRFDAARVDIAVRAVLRARGLCGVDVATTVEATGATVTVRMTRTVAYVFAKAVPGVDHETAVHATERAAAVGAAAPDIVLPFFSVSC